jgi:CheY-like chemotaxis protein
MPARDDDSKSPSSGIAAGIVSVSDALSALIKLILIAGICYSIWDNRSLIGSYIARWLATATHVTFMSLSVDRQAEATDTINKIAKNTRPGFPPIDVEVARGAVVRAARNAPAIVGSRILWVDDKPGNNVLEAKVLADIGIKVQLATSTTEALQLLPVFNPDLIISNVIRPGDMEEPLKNCKAHYFEVPPNVESDLSELNSDLLAGNGKATGFTMAEAISQVDSKFTDHLQPRIIFYSASSAGIATNQCARIITNRADLLLQNVVSALEELNWGRLEDIAPSPLPSQ